MLNRVISQARRASAPAQINVPRDYWTQVIDIELPVIVAFELLAGEEAIDQAATMLSSARFPVILNGAGVVLSGAIDASRRLAERLDAPVCCGYQHNDAFPGSHPLFAGPLGYNGSKAAMQLIAQADVVLALGAQGFWRRVLFRERCSAKASSTSSAQSRASRCRHDHRLRRQPTNLHTRGLCRARLRMASARPR